MGIVANHMRIRELEEENMQLRKQVDCLRCTKFFECELKPTGQCLVLATRRGDSEQQNS